MSAAAPARPGNEIGRMMGLTLFTPVRRQWLPFLRLAFLVSWHAKVFNRHILQFNFIKFVRWTIVRDLPGEGLNYSYMLFESNFDGPWQHYIDAFAYVIPKDIRLTWGRGINFPHPPPSEPLKAWIARNSMEGGTYYCAYPQASTRMVRSALNVRRRFAALVRDAEHMSPEEFQAAYERSLVDAQADL
jgi:hypothetical protein